MRKYINSLTDEDRLLYARKQVNTVLSNLKKMKKASNAEFNYDGCRTGIRGGRRTTLSANSANAAQMYDASMDDLKLLIKLL